MGDTDMRQPSITWILGETWKRCHVYVGIGENCMVGHLKKNIFLLPATGTVVGNRSQGWGIHYPQCENEALLATE